MMSSASTTKTDWPMVLIGDVAKPVKRPEEPLPGTKYRQIGVRLWGVGAYERDVLDGAETRYKALYRVEKDDIIVNKIWARNGSVAVVPAELTGCYASGEFPIFVPVPQSLEPRWFHWITKTKFFWRQCDEKSHGTSGKNRIRPERFLEIEIPLPPLEEQRRIVERIEELAAKVEAARALRQQAAEEAKALLGATKKKLFSEKHMEQWPTIQLGKVGEIRAGTTLGRRLTGPTVRLPYMRVANVQDGYLDLRTVKEVEIRPDEREKWLLKPGDILLTEGGDWDKLGRGTVWQGEIPDCIHQNHIFRVRVDPSEFDPYYLSALISSPYGKTYFQGASKQTTNLATINQRQLKAFTVVKPPLDQQRRIVAHLDALQAQVEAVKQHQSATGAALDALLPSILDRAFKGEL